MRIDNSDECRLTADGTLRNPHTTMLSTQRCIQMHQMFVYWLIKPRFDYFNASHSPVTSLPLIIRHGSPPAVHVTPAPGRSGVRILKFMVCCGCNSDNTSTSTRRIHTFAPPASRSPDILLVKRKTKKTCS